MITLHPTFVSFKTYVRQPIYQQPLADLPGNSSVKLIRQFLNESPLILGLVLVLTGVNMLTRYTTGTGFFRSLVEKYSSAIGILIVAGFIAVIIQEATFRAILRPTPNRLRNITALLLLVPVGQYHRFFQDSTNGLALLWPVPVWFLAVYLLNRYLKQPVVFDRILTFWQVNFRWIFYGIALLYVFPKITGNINTLTSWQLVMMPFILLTLLVNGLYFGYVRMKYGFWYAVAVHALTLIVMLLPEMIRVL